MPIFEYKAFAPGGSTKKGVIDADTPRDARQRLRRDNILVSELTELRSGRRKNRKATKGAKIKKDGIWKRLQDFRQSHHTGQSAKDIEIVCAITRQMGTLLAAGIAMAETLDAIIDQAQTRRIETIFRSIRERITSGTSLGDALAEYPALFSDLYVNMVKAGEATGNVDVVLSRLADFLQAQRALQRKVVSALTYPVMMLVIGFIVVAILVSFVVPKITGMLIDTGQEMPTPTKILIAISDWFKRFWIVIPIGGFILIVIFNKVYATNKGQLAIDRAKLSMPIVGELMRKQAVARFTRTLATLLSSGVPAVRSLEITGAVVGNRVMSDATDMIRTRILEGTDIATPLKQSGVFPSVVGYMVAIGEQSGQLEEMLDRIADSYDEEIEVVTERVTTMLEPLMIVALAGVVGFIVWAIVLPILQVGNV